MKAKKQTTYTTVNFDRQNPSLVLTRIRDKKQVTVFDIAKYPLKAWASGINRRPVDFDKLYCLDDTNELPEAFKLTDIKNGQNVVLIESRDEIFQKQLHLLLYELKCIRQAYRNC